MITTVLEGMRAVKRAIQENKMVTASHWNKTRAVSFEKESSYERVLINL